MKRLHSALLCLVMIILLAACVPSTEKKLTERKAAFLDFKTEWNQSEIRVMNPRVMEDGNGNKMLMADITNHSGYELSQIVIAYAVWDKQGDFCVIQSKQNPENTYDEFQVELLDVVIPKGETWNADQGVYLSEKAPEYVFYEVALVCCKTGDIIYENPLYEEWKEIYLGRYLEEWMKTVS